MVGCRQQLNRHEFEQTLGDNEGWSSLVSCSPWGHVELDTTESLNTHMELCINLMDALPLLTVKMLCLGHLMWASLVLVCQTSGW